jgi:maltose alpha-D-glucosyltransferase / alpha-amylase
MKKKNIIWFKDAIIYQLHVQSFFDSNNDGTGDFPGLIQKLDYLKSLGVNTTMVIAFLSFSHEGRGV